MTVAMRRAVIGDLGAMLACEQTTDPERRAFLESALATEHCRVAVDGTNVVGYAVVAPGHFFGRDFIELLVVSTSHRRGGLGRALLRDAVQTSGTSDTWTSTNRSNAPMRALLVAEGWTFSGELEGLDDDDPELFFRSSRRDL